LLVGAALARVLSLHSLEPVQAAETPVTYSRQIAPILYKNCTGCHHPGGSGPFSLMDYAQAKRWAQTMSTVVASRYMPPWLPEPGHGEFANNRRLSPQDIDLIAAWVRSGMPAGDPGEAPKPPVYNSDWELGPPDLILEVDSPMQVPASGTDLFRNFILPFPGSETRWVRAMEIKPGSPQVVHHANLILDRSGSLRRTHPADWKNGIPGMDVVVDAGERFDPDGHFLDWKPDSTALVEPDGMPWRLDPGNDLVLNMHLKPTGKVESVRARIGLYFTDKPATRLPILVQLEHDAGLNIPPGDANFTVEDQLRLPEPVDVLAIYPHAHYLGKRLEGWADLPDGTRKSLILIPNWDIDRQSIYRYAQPVALPAGSVVHMRYTYDNSAANPHNPNSPPIRVTAGNRSVDEMGHLWLQLLPVVTPKTRSDPRMPILRAWMEDVLAKNPSDPTALFNLAAIDMMEGHPTLAAERYRLALKSRPADSRLLTALAVAQDKTGDWQDAETILQAALAQDATYLDAHFNLGSIELRQGDPAAAEQQFRAVIALAPRDADAYAGLGTALLSEDHALEAREALEKAARLAPANAEILTSLALAEASMGAVSLAITHLQTAAKLQPTSAEAHRGLVALFSAQDQPADAIREQRAILALDATHADDWNDLGVLLARNHDRAAAAEAFRHALKLDPTHAAAKQNLDRLEQPGRY
jgi:Flp pilus assembly protein TadD/mono/diheme cytochrome c family protein